MAPAVPHFRWHVWAQGWRAPGSSPSRSTTPAIQRIQKPWQASSSGGCGRARSSAALDAILADPSFGPRIDASRIGAAGFSIGGFSVLGLAGATVDMAQFQAACAKVPATCDSPPEFESLVPQLRTMMQSDPALRAKLEIRITTPYTTRGRSGALRCWQFPAPRTTRSSDVHPARGKSSTGALQRPHRRRSSSLTPSGFRGFGDVLPA